MPIFPSPTCKSTVEILFGAPPPLDPPSFPGSLVRRLILSGTAQRSRSHRARLQMQQLEHRAMSVWGPRIPPTVGKTRGGGNPKPPVSPSLL